MMNRQILLIIGMIILVLLPLSTAEVYIYNTVSTDNSTSTVTNEGYYQLIDSSPSGITSMKDTSITLYSVVEALPYNLTAYGYNGYVDWCNLTIRHLKHTYEFNLALIVVNKTETVTDSYYFANSSLNSSQFTYNLRDRDYLTFFMKCHYTDVNYLYVENALFGRVTTYMPSFECSDCSENSLEEITHRVDTQQEAINNEVEIYENIQTIVGWNYQIWLIVSWILKIGFILLGVALIVMSVYYFYQFLLELARTK